MMKKVNVILMALAMLFAFSSCSDDNKKDDDNGLKIEKKHNDALLLVTFGSTWDAPHKTYEKMVATYKKAFPNRDVYLSFTSTICITRWNAKTGELYVTPDIFLKELAEAGYKNIAVQSLHVIPGEEYLLLKNTYVADFKKNHPNIPVVLGNPLLYSQEDIKEVGNILYNAFKPQLDKGQEVIFMGHGNPKKEYNEPGHNVNQCYIDLQTALQKKAGKQIFVGTVDFEPMLIPEILKELDNNVKKGTVVNLTPLMSIAGDHANNDMAGDYDSAEKPEDQSWKVQINKAGYKVTDKNCVLKGLGDYPAIVNIWIQHTKNAIMPK